MAHWDFLPFALPELTSSLIFTKLPMIRQERTTPLWCSRWQSASSLKQLSFFGKAYRHHHYLCDCMSHKPQCKHLSGHIGTRLDAPRNPSSGAHAQLPTCTCNKLALLQVFEILVQGLFDPTQRLPAETQRTYVQLLATAAAAIDHRSAPATFFDTHPQA